MLLVLWAWNGAGNPPEAAGQTKPVAEAKDGPKEVASRFLDLTKGWPKTQELPEPVLENPLVFPSVQKENRKKVLAYVLDIEAKVLKEYETTTNAGLKAMNAWFLRECWQRGFLSAKVKGELLDRHFRAELYQFAAPHPSFAAFADLTFPFPPIWTDFDPVLHVNGKPAGTGGKSAHAMNVNQATLGSQTGGVLKNGDILQYKIKISQRDAHGELWERVIKSNPIRLDKLQER